MISIALLLVAGPFSVETVVEVRATPGALTPREAAAWKEACTAVARRLGPPKRRWVVSFRRAQSPAGFARRTQRPRYEAAAWYEGQIWLQARKTLARFGRLDAVRRHECVHAWRSAAGLPPLPIVLEEGLAAGVSAERLPVIQAMPPDELAALADRLRAPRTSREARQARGQARATVWPVLQKLNADVLQRRLRAIADRPAGAQWWPLLTTVPRDN